MAGIGDQSYFGGCRFGTLRISQADIGIPAGRIFVFSQDGLKILGRLVRKVHFITVGRTGAPDRKPNLYGGVENLVSRATGAFLRLGTLWCWSKLSEGGNGIRSISNVVIGQL